MTSEEARTVKLLWLAKATELTKEVRSELIVFL